MALMDETNPEQVAVAVARKFEFKLAISVVVGHSGCLSLRHRLPGNESNAVMTRLRLRFSLWQNGLPADALPEEGWMELPLLRQEDMITHW